MKLYTVKNGLFSLLSSGISLENGISGRSSEIKQTSHDQGGLSDLFNAVINGRNISRAMTKRFGIQFIITLNVKMYFKLQGWNQNQSKILCKYLPLIPLIEK